MVLVGVVVVEKEIVNGRRLGAEVRGRGESERSTTCRLLSHTVPFPQAAEDEDRRADEEAGSAVAAPERGV